MGQEVEERQNRKNKGSSQQNETGDSRVESIDCSKIPVRGRHQTSLASLWGCYRWHTVLHRLYTMDTIRFHTTLYTWWTPYSSTQSLQCGHCMLVHRLYTADTIWFYSHYTIWTPKHSSLYTDFPLQTPHGSIDTLHWTPCQLHRLSTANTIWFYWYFTLDSIPSTQTLHRRHHMVLLILYTGLHTIYTDLTLRTPYSSQRYQDCKHHMVLHRFYTTDELVGALSPVSHKGFHQGWKQTSIHLLIIPYKKHVTTKFFNIHKVSLDTNIKQSIQTLNTNFEKK